jgi:hypothetical protein
MFDSISTTIKMGALCVLILLLGCATTYGAWQWRAGIARTEVQAAIDMKDAEIQRERDATKKWRDKATALSDEAREAKSKANMVTATATAEIKHERAANPKFYEQAIPDGGAKQWEEARKLMQ